MISSRLFLALLCGGLFMCAQKESRSAANPGNAAQSGLIPKVRSAEASNPAVDEKVSSPIKKDWIEVATSEGPLFIIKAAESRRRPKGNYFGKAEFESSIAAVSGERWLMHVLLPNAARGIRLRYIADGRERALEEPRLVFRMPDSPLHTFVVVDANGPGRLEAIRDGKVIGTLNMADDPEALEAMQLRWNRNTETVSYQGLPASLKGKTPD